MLEAAAHVFYQRGYADAAVQDVADELGILKGSLYHYIETKEDLLFGVLIDVRDAVDDILRDVSERPDLGPLDRLRLYVEQIVLYNTRHLEKIWVYYHDIDLLSTERHQILLARRRPHECFVTRLIDDAQARGEAAPTDSGLVGNLLFGSLVWIYRWYKPRRGVRPEQIAWACADFVIGGSSSRRRSGDDSGPRSRIFVGSRARQSTTSG